MKQSPSVAKNPSVTHVMPMYRWKLSEFIHVINSAIGSPPSASSTIHYAISDRSTMLYGIPSNSIGDYVSLSRWIAHNSAVVNFSIVFLTLPFAMCNLLVGLMPE